MTPRSLHRPPFAALSYVAMLATLAATSAPQANAQAQAQPQASASPYTLTGNVGLASQYRYRGIAQTDGDPAIQGGFDVGHASGLYVGTWASNVSWLSDAGAGAVSNSVEVDVYGGYKGSFGEFAYDVGVLRYLYPGSYPPGFTSPHTTEVYIGGGWRMFSLKYSHSVTNLFGVPDSEGSGYLDLGASIEIGAGYTLVAHVGHQAIPSGTQGGLRIRSSSDCSYTDWKLGATKEFVGLTWSLAWVDTNAKAAPGECYRSARNRDLGKGTAVLSVGKTF